MNYQKEKNYTLLGSVIILGLVLLVSQLANSCSEKRMLNRLEKKTGQLVNFSLPSEKLNEIKNQVNYINSKDFYLDLYVKNSNQHYYPLP